MNARLSKIQGTKSKIEQVHLKYLCEQFSLKSGKSLLYLNNGRFDLVSEDEKVVFELKSRIHPKNNLKSQDAWWAPHNHQIELYKEYCDVHTLSIYFMFLLGYINKPLSEYKRIDERIIQNREIYVLPWEVCELALPSDGKKQRSIGLNKILQEYDFKTEEFTKGQLYIGENIVQQIDYIFNFKVD